jgi:uncharacterized membrane protein
MDNKFEFVEAIKFGWEKMKANFWLFFTVLVIMALISAASDRIDKIQKDNFNFSLIFASLAISLVSIFIQMGLTKITLLVHDNLPASLDDLHKHQNRFLDFLIALIVYSVVVVIGIILLIIPGIIWAVKYQFMPYFVIDKNMKPMEAFSASAKATDGQKMNLFLFGLLLALFNLAGALCLLVGLFFTIPASAVAMAYVYRKLTDQAIPVPAQEIVSTTVEQTPTPTASI